jgi:hypothetical protein
VAAETTLLAKKGGLALAIGRRTKPTTATRLARISRVDQPDLHPCPSCFVCEEQAQLEEGPAVPFIAVFAPNHCRVPDTSEIFQGQCLARYNGFLDQGLRYLVIDVSHEAALPPAHLLETAFRRTSAYPLQASATGDKVAAFRAHGGPRKLLARAICGDIYQTQVYPNGLFRRGHIRGLFALGEMQEIDAVAPHQFRAADFPIRVSQHPALALTWEQAGENTPLYGIERDAVEGKQAVGTRIVADAATRAKLRTHRRFGWWHELLAFPLPSDVRFSPADQLLGFLGAHGTDSFHGFCTSADRQLRAQPEAGASLPIDAVMRRVGIGDVFIPTHSSNLGGGLVEATLRLGKRRFMARSIQFNADGSRKQSVHKRGIAQMFQNTKRGERQGEVGCGTWQFLPRMMPGVSLPHPYDVCRAISRALRGVCFEQLKEGGVYAAKSKG